MRRIAVVNLKGGSAKTTTSLCLAVGMAGAGRQVLLVDADAQANSTMTLIGEGQGGAPGPTLGPVLLGKARAAEAIRPTRVAGLDLLPADGSLADAALQLADAIGREHRFRRAMESLDPIYDVAIVDCPPSLSLVSVNVLAAAGEVICPCDAGIYSVAGLAQLQQAIADVREYLDNPTLRLAGLVLTKAHHNRATRDIEGQLREAFGPLVYAATVPHSVKVEEAHARGLTVIEHSPTSAPSKAYLALVAEILNDGDQSAEQGGPFLRGGAGDAEARRAG